ncbi:transcription initiation factor IIB [Halopiger xanaduensis]|uniref:Transcription factor TFIIB cyclin-related protein n=1 Tax=Halopiger xanaduensis (strain DSM 18323 / JCM 14033 / SH-6) TaxID=797210 RepID=F8DE27_HALXS|nr:transcription initiation factor IIB family protein [Halopiger xanaduensis]AEH39303.1 Transcription factor TFIIB cyclin-related protein [Halopiger xanaduensis SH-6]
MATDQTVSSRSTRDASQQSQSTLSCPECSGTLVTANREAHCRECGLIVDENQLDHGPEWFASEADSSRRRTGAPLTAGRHDRGLSTEIGRYRDGQGNTLSGQKRRQLNRLRREHRRSQWRSKRERNLATGLGEVRRLVSALGLSDSLREQACSLFRRAQKEDLCRGRSLEGVAAASVYAVSRCNGLGRPLEEISQVATCSRSQLECAYSAMNTELELPTAVPQPKSVLPRLATELGAPDEIQYRALELATIAANVGITTGRHPHGFAAACLYRAGQERGWMTSQQELAAVSNTSPKTIRAHRDTLLEVLEDQEKG